MEPILRKYLEKMAQTYGIVDSRGVMQVYRIVELPLDEVFVNLTARLSPRRGEERRAAIARLQKLASGDRKPVESPSNARPAGEEWFRERIEEGIPFQAIEGQQLIHSVDPGSSSLICGIDK
ncbi:MAG: hypothetical protein ACREAQ_03205 [Nitrososphaera sp.]